MHKNVELLFKIHYMVVKLNSDKTYPIVYINTMTPHHNPHLQVPVIFWGGHSLFLHRTVIKEQSVTVFKEEPVQF